MTSELTGYREYAKAARSGPPISDEGLQQVGAHIQSLYDSGTPFFTKQQLIHVGHQLAEATNARATRQIVVNGLDGVPVEFEVEIGRIYPTSFLRGQEVVVKYAALYYNTPEHLARYSNNRTTAYCQIQVRLQLYVVNGIPEISPFQPDVEIMFKHNRRTWEASEPCRQLKETLALATAPSDIAKVIGFAFGPFAGKGFHDKYAIRSETQHALLLTLRDIFSQPGREAQIPCYAQDPVYSAADKAVLGASGVTVLDDPFGFVEVDDESVVVSFYPDCPVKEIVFDLAMPAVILWQEMEELNETPPILLCDPEGSRVKKRLLEFYDELKFPLGEEHFGKICYGVWRTLKQDSRDPMFVAPRKETLEEKEELVYWKYGSKAKGIEGIVTVVPIMFNLTWMEKKAREKATRQREWNVSKFVEHCGEMSLI